MVWTIWICIRRKPIICRFVAGRVYRRRESRVYRPDVHIGTDEYNKKEAEQYRYFTDRYLKYIEKYGKTPRMWGGLKWLPGKTPVKAEGVTVNAVVV